MILDDRTLVKRIRYTDGAHAIAFAPDIEDDQIQPASVDLRLGDTVIDPVTGEEQDIDSFMTVAPGGFCLPAVKESVTVPNDLVGLMTGRSTYGRKGLTTHVTAGLVDPGWTGTLTMEMANVGTEPVALEPGDRVAQIMFVKTVSESSGYDGKYQGAEGPEASKEDE